MGSLGTAHLALGHLSVALVLYEEALKIFRELGDRRGEASALASLGSAHFRMEEFRQAIEFYRQGLDLTRELGDRRGEIRILTNLGTAHIRLGETKLVKELYTQAICLFSHRGDRQSLAVALCNMGGVHAETEDWDYSIMFCREALESRARSAISAEQALLCGISAKYSASQVFIRRQSVTLKTL